MISKEVDFLFFFCLDVTIDVEFLMCSIGVVCSQLLAVVSIGRSLTFTMYSVYLSAYKQHAVLVYLSCCMQSFHSQWRNYCPCRLRNATHRIF